MEMKQNQTFFDGTYSNLTPFLSKHIKVCQLTFKIKFPSFMTKVNPHNGNEQNQIFFQGAYLNLTLFSLVVKY